MSAIFIRVEYNHESHKDIRTTLLECIELCKVVKVPIKIKFERSDKHGSTEYTISGNTRIEDYDLHHLDSNRNYESGIPPYRK